MKTVNGAVIDLAHGYLTEPPPRHIGELLKVQIARSTGYTLYGQPLGA